MYYIYLSDRILDCVLSIGYFYREKRRNSEVSLVSSPVGYFFDFKFRLGRQRKKKNFNELLWY